MALDDGADKRSAIIEAASALFAELGYRGTSIARVAREVGLTDAGVLYHFKTKEELLLGVLERYGQMVEEGLAASQVSGIDLLRTVREWGAGMEAQPEISMLLIHLTTEHLTDDSPARRFLQKSYRRGLDRYRRAFTEAAANGDLRADVDPDAEAADLIAHLDGIRLQWFLLDRPFSLADAVRHHVDGVLERLAPPS